MFKFAPSILTSDFANLQSEIKKLEEGGAPYLHLDIMDGQFVKNITFGAPVVKRLRPHSNMTFDVHLMIKDPLLYIDDFAAAGADIITFHVNSSSDVEETLKKIKSHGLKCGLAVNPDIDIELLYPYKEYLDMVLVMTVYAGFGGQSYIEASNEKIKKAREFFGPDIDIEVDGGIYKENKHVPISHGANVLVAGSAVFNNPDVVQAVRDFINA